MTNAKSSFSDEQIVRVLRDAFLARDGEPRRKQYLAQNFQAMMARIEAAEKDSAAAQHELSYAASTEGEDPVESSLVAAESRELQIIRGGGQSWDGDFPTLEDLGIELWLAIGVDGKSAWLQVEGGTLPQDWECIAYVPVRPAEPLMEAAELPFVFESPQNGIIKLHNLIPDELLPQDFKYVRLLFSEGKIRDIGNLLMQVVDL